MLSVTLIKYCSLFVRRIDRDDLRIFLESSPQYPSLLSVLQTLRYAGLQANAGKCDIEHLKTMSGTVLLHLKSPAKESVVIAKLDSASGRTKIYSVNSGKWESRSFEQLEKVWNGVVIYVENKPVAKTEFMVNVTVVLSFLLLCFLTNLFLGISNSLLILPAISGFAVSLFLYLQESGMRVNLINRICHVSSAADCDAVARSSFSKFWGISLTNAAVVYFLAQIICLAVMHSDFISCLGELYAVSFVFLLPLSWYSLYYQRRLRKICPLCILILLSLTVEAALFPMIKGAAVGLTTTPLFLIVFPSLLFILVSIDNLRKKRDERIHSNTLLLSVKRDKNIILIKSRPVTFARSSALVIKDCDNGDGNNSVTAIISPGCDHCRKFMRELLELQKKDINFSCEIILGISGSNDVNDIKAWVQTYIANKDDFRMQLEKWSEGESIRPNPKYNYADKYAESEIYQSFSSTIKNLNIKGYPQLIFNRRLMSDIYSPADLKYLIADNVFL